MLNGFSGVSSGIICLSLLLQLCESLTSGTHIHYQWGYWWTQITRLNSNSLCCVFMQRDRGSVHVKWCNDSGVRFFTSWKTFWLIKVWPIWSTWCWEQVVIINLVFPFVFCWLLGKCKYLDWYKLSALLVVCSILLILNTLIGFSEANTF